MTSRQLFSKSLRVVIVAENASMSMGGEAARPLQYFLHLRDRVQGVWLVVHERNRQELDALIPDAMVQVRFASDRWIQKLLWRLGRLVPSLVNEMSFTALIHLITQTQQRRIVRTLVREEGVALVHEPTPISPKRPSLMYGVGVPVVIGPLNGGMDYPPAFQNRERGVTRVLVRMGRSLSGMFNWLIPGKRRADAILVSNDRTEAALPAGCRRNVRHLVANAVDTSKWKVTAREAVESDVRFVFLGRLVPFKGVDLLIRAFRKVVAQTDACLEIIGDGSETNCLIELSQQAGLADRISFLGWIDHDEAVNRMTSASAFVFPSLRDPGGAVIMEAMCLGLPIIAADWGGSQQYTDPASAILVSPESEESYVDGLAEAMIRLANSPELRASMGEMARSRAQREFDWSHRVDSLITIYESILVKNHSASGATAP